MEFSFLPVAFLILILGLLSPKNKKGLLYLFLVCRGPQEGFVLVLCWDIYFYAWMLYAWMLWTMNLHIQCYPEEGIRFHYRWLWATIWSLGVELRTSGRAASALNGWAISPALVFVKCFVDFIIETTWLADSFYWKGFNYWLNCFVRGLFLAYTSSWVKCSRSYISRYFAYFKHEHEDDHCYYLFVECWWWHVKLERAWQMFFHWAKFLAPKWPF